MSHPRRLAWLAAMTVYSLTAPATVQLGWLQPWQLILLSLGLMIATGWLCLRPDMRLVRTPLDPCKGIAMWNSRRNRKGEAYYACSDVDDRTDPPTLRVSFTISVEGGGFAVRPVTEADLAGLRRLLRPVQLFVDYRQPGAVHFRGDLGPDGKPPYEERA